MTDETNPKDILGFMKPPLRLVPASLWLIVSKVFQLGARKYGPMNWRTKKVRRTVYLEAALRHVLCDLEGEAIDPESGQPHAAHAIACLAIILDADACGCLIDDRLTPGPAAALIEKLTEKEPGAPIAALRAAAYPDSRHSPSVEQRHAVAHIPKGSKRAR